MKQNSKLSTLVYGGEVVQTSYCGKLKLESLFGVVVKPNYESCTKPYNLNMQWNNIAHPNILLDEIRITLSAPSFHKNL